MNKRIFTVRQFSELSMRAFGERIGISGPSVARLESGENNPSEQTIRAICSEFNINRDWLVDGIGEMSVKKPLTPEVIHKLRKYPRTLEALAEMTDDELTSLEGFLSRYFDQKQK